MLAVAQTSSAVILRLEKALLIVLAASVTGLILLNVVTRSLDRSIFWVDELAIYTMIWLVMVGASAKVRLRKGIAVTLVDTVLSRRALAVLQTIVDVIIWAFAVALVVLCWIWFDPLTLALKGFDIAAFSSASFNFIYQEPTNTIGLPKYLVWLIMPFTSLTMAVHATTNLLERLAGREHGAEAFE